MNAVARSMVSICAIGKRVALTSRNFPLTEGCWEKESRASLEMCALGEGTLSFVEQLAAHSSRRVMVRVPEENH